VKLNQSCRFVLRSITGDNRTMGSPCISGGISLASHSSSSLNTDSSPLTAYAVAAKNHRPRAVTWYVPAFFVPKLNERSRPVFRS
jgi:hypothetical protein